MSACNLTQVGGFKNGELDSCLFAMENTKYGNNNIDGFGYWLETPDSSDSWFAWIVYASGNFPWVRNADLKFGARPVIEVPKSKISY